MAEPFATTLLLLWFVTQPGHIEPNTPKLQQEMDAAWTLQSTTQIPTEGPDICTALAVKMLKEVDPVNTLTLRAYCLCPRGDGSKECFNEQTLTPKAGRKTPEISLPTILRIGPRTNTPAAMKIAPSGVLSPQ